MFFVQCSSNSGKVTSVQDFDKYLKSDKNAVILDLRTDDEVSLGVLKGAVQLDFHDPEFQDKLESLDRNKSYYIYCKSGGRSAKTAELMADLGFKTVYDLEGGFAAWSASNMPVVMPD